MFPAGNDPTRHSYLPSLLKHRHTFHVLGLLLLRQLEYHYFYKLLQQHKSPSAASFYPEPHPNLLSAMKILPGAKEPSMRPHAASRPHLQEHPHHPPTVTFWWAGWVGHNMSPSGTQLGKSNAGSTTTDIDQMTRPAAPSLPSPLGTEDPQRRTRYHVRGSVGWHLRSLIQ